MKSKLINIVSGKGGTGKTLFSAVLADALGTNGAKVLVVDMDVFVCGLSTLFYYENSEAMRLVPDGMASVSVCHYFLNRNKDAKVSDKPVKPAVLQYPERAFHIIPALDRIDQPFHSKDLLPDDYEDAKHLIRMLFRDLPQDDFDYILFDNRAGYDQLVAATHAACDLSICVEEDDNISLLTSTRLISLLGRESRTPIYRIRNKVRPTSNDIALKMGVDFLGSIAFEHDIFNSFGTTQFWSKLRRSTYRPCLCEIWNMLAKKEQFKHTFNLHGTPKNNHQNSVRSLIMFYCGLSLLFLCVSVILYGFLMEIPSNNLLTVLLSLCSALGISMVFASRLEISITPKKQKKKRD